MKKNSLLIIIYFSTLIVVNGQVLDKQVENVIVKNIVSYHFRYALNYDLNLNSNGLLLSDDKLFFLELWPNRNNALKIKVSESNLGYPKSNYKIYSLYKKGFQLGNDTISTYRTLSSLPSDDYYLIAYDKQSGKIKFLSGNFFKSLISSDFSLNEKKPNSFYEYLKIKLYNFECKDIKFKQITKKGVYFSAYSQSLKEFVLLVVARENFDLVTIMDAKGKTTY